MKVNNFIRLFPVLLFSFSVPALAQVIYATNGSVVTVQVDRTYGATLELPSAVHVVTPPKYLRVEPLVEPNSVAVTADPNTATNDVKVFQVYPSNLKNYEDKMTFLLWNGKNISVKFVYSNSISDNFYQIKLPSSSDSSQTRFSSNSKYFLSDEKSLMVKMLKDDNTSDRKIVDARVRIDKYPNLLVKLVRIFKQDSLTGYTFTLTNTSSSTINLNPTVLTIGEPNKIKMIQTDHEELQSCKENNNPDPRGTGCMTAVRIVIHDANDFDPSSAGIGTNSNVPFTVVQSDSGKRGGM